MRSVTFLFSAVLFLGVCSVSCAQMNEKIVAVVGDEVIIQSELDESLRPVLKQYKALFEGEELEKKYQKAREEILDQMVKDELILQEAGKLDITVEEEAVEERLNEMIDKFPSEQKFLEALKNEGLSIESLRDKYREQLIIRKLTNIEVRAKVALGPQELLDYYNLHKTEFSDSEQVKLKTILIRVREGDNEESIKTRVNEIRSMLLEGMDFGRLALISSEGPESQSRGDMGFVGMGELLEQVDKVIFNLKPGEISEAVRTDIGYHIFKVEVKKEARVKEFKEVKQYIEDKLFQQKAVTRFNEWMSKIKENVYISIK